MKKINILPTLLVSFSLLIPSTVSAQVNSASVAVSYPVNDTEAQDGDIICSYTTGNVRCNRGYDPAILGIYTQNPAVAIEDTELPEAKLIVTSGVAQVRVSAVSGNIVQGDFVSTSETPGVGQKAVRNGYVVGTALEDYAPQNPDDIGSITVAINVHPAAGLTGPGSNLLQFIREGIAVPLFEPLESLRYILAVAMVLISFTLGMIYFGRASRAGIEAIGRNPLAQRMIQLSVVLNIVLTIVIVLVGLAIAYLILIL